jgi:hypothetical protein
MECTGLVLQYVEKENARGDRGRPLPSRMDRRLSQSGTEGDYTPLNTRYQPLDPTDTLHVGRVLPTPEIRALLIRAQVGKHRPPVRRKSEILGILERMRSSPLDRVGP